MTPILTARSARRSVRFTRSDLEGAEALLEKAKNKYKQLPPAEVMLAKMLSRCAESGGDCPRAA